MTLWTVKTEFAPVEGGTPRSKAELATIASAVRAHFADVQAAAHGSGDQFVATAKFEAEEEADAEAWGRTVLYDFIDDALPDWRLDRLVVWRGDS